MPVRPREMGSLDRPAVGLVLAALPLRALLALSTDLSPDEAYYLAAARLDLQLADHPPLTGWLLAATDTLTSLPLELRTRLPALVLGTVFGLLVLDLVRGRGGSGESQRWAALFSAWYVLPVAGGFVTTPDAVLLCSTVALLRLTDVTPRSLPLHAALVGSLCFVGMLAKVVMLALVIPLVLLGNRKLDRAAAAAGVVVALPYALPSLLFQLDHAFVDRQQVIGGVAAVVGALAAQLALWGPAVLLFGWRRSADHRLDRPLILVLAGLVILSAALRGVAPEPNWFAPAAATLAAGASHAMPRAPTWARITAVILGPVAVLVLASHVIHPWIPVARHLDPSARLHGWSRGEPPTEAPGVGPYGPAAEACVYRDECEKMLDKANTSGQLFKRWLTPAANTRMD